ncbi:hypothetical protein [Actinoplanes sp. NPDC049118]|uniref:TolB family protein n=1 Tax=Actinoplanes sp. NPDC049118 TaxID=3155769 RepID=UPI0034102770
MAFASNADNLVPGDTNGTDDVFVRDVVAGTTTRVSVATDGTRANSWSWPPEISADGRHVAFVSDADNLVPGDTNQHADIFLRDLAAGTTSRVNIGSNGQESDKEVDCPFTCMPSLSRDGRYVTFASYATNLVPDDTNGSIDVFVRDVVAGTTTRANVATDGTTVVSAPGPLPGYDPVMTADGRRVFFLSSAPLVLGDTNGKPDLYMRDLNASSTTMIKPLGREKNDLRSFTVSANGRYLGFDKPRRQGDPFGLRDAFVCDLVTGVSTRVSLSNDGAEGNATSTGSWISPDGGSVVFTSEATNLVDGDTNLHGDVFLHHLSTPEPAAMSRTQNITR